MRYLPKTHMLKALSAVQQFSEVGLVEGDYEGSDLIEGLSLMGS